MRHTARMTKQSRGMCRACGYVGTKASMTKHQASCQVRAITAGKPREVYRLRVDGGGPFWLDIEADVNGTLDDIDAFLRGIWLECCGHLSQFTIGPEPEWMDDAWSPFAAPKKKGKKAAPPKLTDLLSVGQKFGYTYDMGSSTDLELTVQARETSYAFDDPVVLLARNLPPVWTCSQCDSNAKWIHSWEYDEETGLPKFYCGRHGRSTRDEQLPVVNSPRMGTCAYEGGTSDNWPPPEKPAGKKEAP